ncbi:MAG: hypothetical protein ABI231_09750, partial [Candidatus Tumulicola sp.]
MTTKERIEAARGGAPEDVESHMGFGIGFAVLIGLAAQTSFFERRPAPWGNPRGVHLDGALVAI